MQQSEVHFLFVRQVLILSIGVRTIKLCGRSFTLLKVKALAFVFAQILSPIAVITESKRALTVFFKNNSLSINASIYGY